MKITERGGRRFFEVDDLDGDRFKLFESRTRSGVFVRANLVVLDRDMAREIGNAMIHFADNGRLPPPEESR